MNRLEQELPAAPPSSRANATSDRSRYLVAPQRLGMRTALHAEWTKLRTLSGTYWLLATAVAVTVAVDVAIVSATRCPAGPGCPRDTAQLSLTGVQPRQAVRAIPATTGICSAHSIVLITCSL